MKRFLGYFIPSLLIIAAIFGLVFGAILPFYRARIFNEAINSLPDITNLNEFKDVFNKAFNFYAPVGEEEIGRFTANDILKMISKTGQPKDDSRTIVDYIEPHLLNGDVRDIITIGQMRLVLGINFREEGDFKESEARYFQALAISPRFPIVLYGLLDLYKSKNDKDKMNSMAEKIIAIWPEDAETRSFLSK
ncbi:MAG: hypothetical protein ABSE68_00975 [Minisyncoccia bacterium]